MLSRDKVVRQNRAIKLQVWHRSKKSQLSQRNRATLSATAACYKQCDKPATVKRSWQQLRHSTYRGTKTQKIVLDNVPGGNTRVFWRQLNYLINIHNGAYNKSRVAAVTIMQFDQFSHFERTACLCQTDTSPSYTALCTRVAYASRGKNYSENKFLNSNMVHGKTNCSDCYAMYSLHVYESMRLIIILTAFCVVFCTPCIMHAASCVPRVCREMLSVILIYCDYTGNSVQRPGSLHIKAHSDFGYSHGSPRFSWWNDRWIILRVQKYGILRPFGSKLGHIGLYEINHWCHIGYR